MPCHTHRVYVQVIDPQTRKTVEHLGPYSSAAEARTVCGTLLGQALIWTRDELDWVAELDGHEYRIPADPAAEA